MNNNVTSGRLAELEAIIETGMRTFVEVGNALRTIRDTRMYREQGYKTFDDYCRARWNWSKTHANRQIQAAKVAEEEAMTPMGVIPANERQARQMRQGARGDVDTTASLHFSVPLAQTSRVAFHPAAYAYRNAVDGKFLEGLAVSIRRIGLLAPILVMPDSLTIIDGRYRFLACHIAGVEPWFRRWDGGTSWDEIEEVAFMLHDTFKRYTEAERDSIQRQVLNDFQ